MVGSEIDHHPYVRSNTHFIGELITSPVKAARSLGEFIVGLLNKFAWQSIHLLCIFNPYLDNTLCIDY